MKKLDTAPRRFRAGFTLVELLTVIAIIGILAAMLLPVLAAAKKAAQKRQAGLDIAGIVSAIEGYDQAYGRFPTSQKPASGDFTYGGVYGGQTIGTPVGGFLAISNAEVIAILMDYTNYPGTSIPTVNNGHVKNPQGTKFLTTKMSGWDPSQPNAGPPLPGVGNDLVFRDPWGNPYLITMDLNYDDACNDWVYSLTTVSSSTGAPNAPGLNGLNNPNGAPNNYQFHGKEMVWSAGPDGKVDYNSGVNANAGVNKDNILSWK